MRVCVSVCVSYAGPTDVLLSYNSVAYTLSVEQKVLRRPSAGQSRTLKVEAKKKGAPSVAPASFCESVLHEPEASGCGS